jgi:hypothetical protein
MLAPEHITVSEKATEKQSESPKPLLPNEEKKRETKAMNN